VNNVYECKKIDIDKFIFFFNLIFFLYNKNFFNFLIVALLQMLMEMHQTSINAYNVLKDIMVLMADVKKFKKML